MHESGAWDILPSMVESLLQRQGPPGVYPYEYAVARNATQEVFGTRCTRAEQSR